MRILFLCILAFCTMLSTSNAAVKGHEKQLTLRMPEAVLAKTIGNTLPLEINATSQRLQGSLTILAIDQLHLNDGQLHCTLHLKGNQLQFVTKVAKHEIRLKTDTMDIHLDGTATLRFDPKQQTLFIQPNINNKRLKKSNKSPDIGQALTSLINTREFPITLQNVAPLVARTGAKTLNIATKIQDIKIDQGALLLFLTPEISTN
ncbi:MAG: hypothetical protein CSA21_06845 [Deltaproteobacteria bacterium]|nr:MAG: hypothetical protein CSA21_06845 [Deltaproteobacteria bacterium]